MLDTHLTTHTHLYLLICTHTIHILSSLNTNPHMPSLYFLHTNAQATKIKCTFSSKEFLHINTLNTHNALFPSSRFSPYLFFFSSFFFFLLRAFIEDTDTCIYFLLSSHSTAVLWYRRAGKGTRLSLSGSLREHCFHLDRYLFSNVPEERPTCPLGDWCTEGMRGGGRNHLKDCAINSRCEYTL